MRGPVIHCIHDDAREDRLVLLQKEIQEQQLEVRFWPAVKDPYNVSFRAICKAHKQIVAWAKEENLEEVLIMEDDCFFFAPGAFQYYVGQKPPSYDLYFGNVFFPPTIPAGGRLDDLCGLTLYFVNSRFYDRFLAVKEMNHLDRELGKMSCEKYVCLPMVCSQHDGYSDNKRTHGSYQKYHAGHPLFGR